MKERKKILLTNDDGIRSPGLWAAAKALSALGYVTVVAPREQSSAMGRSMPVTSDGVIREERVRVNGQEWPVYAVGGSPAQAVQHGVLRVAAAKPDLVVSGINYGENLAFGVSVSGTVGAAMEAVSLGIPALAVSLETEKKFHLSYSDAINFDAAAYFLALFAKKMLNKQFPPQANLLKIDVPSQATRETPWRVTRLSPNTYYHPIAEGSEDWSQPYIIDYNIGADWETEPKDTDVYAIHKECKVSVTPLTLDCTARVDLQQFDRFLRE